MTNADRSSPPKETGLGFPKSSRIVRGSDFTIAMRRGGCAADGVLVVFAISRRQEDASSSKIRLGVTIAKKTGNAVVRNRWKRWIRETFRIQRNAFPAGYDFVVRPKKGAEGSWEAIACSLPKLAAKAVSRIRP